jgi:hypothetical protein
MRKILHLLEIGLRWLVSSVILSTAERKRVCNDVTTRITLSLLLWEFGFIGIYMALHGYQLLEFVIDTGAY